eukprot:5872764-Pleurochrysis_carterae.AAC.1
MSSMLFWSPSASAPRSREAEGAHPCPTLPVSLMPLPCPCRSQACRFRNAQPATGRDAELGAEAGAGVRRLVSLFASCGCRGRAHS